MSLWDYYNDIYGYGSLPQSRKDKILKVMMDKNYVNNSSFATLVVKLLDHIDSTSALAIFKNYLDNGSSGSGDADAAYSMVNKMYSKYEDKEIIKDLIKASKHKKILRTLLMLDNISVKEEVLGLRALAGMVYSPNILYINKYSPSVEAIKELPPIMRLQAFESLLNFKNMAYNIFINFKNPEEFKSLLFGSVLRHRSRAEKVWEKFQETSNLGIESTVLIKSGCDNCGDYDIAIKSTRVRTITGFQKTSIGRRFLDSSCPLCGKWGQKEKEIICESKE